MIINFNQDATLMPPSIIVRLICIFLICTICIQCTHPATQEADKIKNLFSKKMEAEGFFLLTPEAQ
ncbi:MAG: hypothetical protein HWD61_06775 [Parachlamydiaceae bacterium]|nr:MAG: hypothetical protein HWD61_06775 [Parachlamydiaceae bacterium]